MAVLVCIPTNNILRILFLLHPYGVFYVCGRFISFICKLKLWSGMGGRDRKNERETQRENLPSTDLLPMAVMARAGPVLNWEPGASSRFSMWVLEFKVLGHPSLFSRAIGRELI